ncbi:LamG domain-containing protein [Seonamhaeicola sp.]|uniref:LamG domain-containing protein n=1 Tax=Seonamhaeicola sp. TaxID=1912245 RepID=UPI00261B435C|nr:LamG domain-containing protein [Seonamhaeicola sp.]
MKKLFSVLILAIITLHSCNDDDLNIIDYTEFDSTLTEAQTTADVSKEGEKNGDIIIGSTAILNAVIEIHAPYRTTAINQGTIDLATKRLRTAIDTYNSSIVIVDGTSLESTISNAQSLHDAAVEGDFPGEYQAGSKAILQSAIDAARVVANNTDATQAMIDGALSALLSALNDFNDAKNPPLDFDALNTEIDAAQDLHDSAVEGTQIGDYTIGSKTILQNAINAAEIIASSTEGITQSDIDDALATLQAAVETFNAARIGGPDRDITALLAGIANAQTIHDTAIEGSELGQYPVGAKATLQTAIDTAQSVADDLSTGQSIVDAALATLQDAVVAFENSVNGIYVVNFDGASYIETPTFQGISGGTQRTVEAWIKTDASKTTETLILSWGIGSNQQKWDMRLNSGRLRVEYQGGGINTTKTVNDGIWHHVAAVVPTDGASLEDVLLYIDGELQTDITGSGSSPINTSNANNFHIGRSANDATRLFVGQISDVRMWNVAKSANDINTNKDVRLNGNESGLVGYWKLNDGSGTSAQDATSSNHTGNFVGNLTWEKITTGLPFQN